VRLVDSNVLVYAFDASDKRKHEIAKKLLEDCAMGGETLGLSVQNLSEFFFVSTQKLKHFLPPAIARNAVESLCSIKNFSILPIESADVLKAVRLCDDFHAHYWDCLLASVMLRNGIFEIYTENVGDFSRLPGIKAINPFT